MVWLVVPDSLLALQLDPQRTRLYRVWFSDLQNATSEVLSPCQESKRQKASQYGLHGKECKI